MSARREGSAMTLAWALVGVSVVCAALLQRMLFGGIDLLEPLVPIALLHGAQLSAVLAHGLTWRRGGSSVHWAAALLTYGTTLSWMLTWCAPLQDLYAWLGNGLRLLLELGWAP